MSSTPIRQPELTELTTFVLAAERGSISAAARYLRISPAAATKRLNNLDALSRGKLLERTSHGVQPTRLGHRLLPAARRLLRDAETLLDSLSEVRPRPLEGLHRTLHGGGHAAPDVLLADLEGLIACVFRGVSEPLVIADADGIVIDANPAYCRLTGVEQINLVGRPVPGLDVSATAELAAGSLPATLQTADGEYRVVSYALKRLELARLPLVLIRVCDCKLTTTQVRP